MFPHVFLMRFHCFSVFFSVFQCFPIVFQCFFELSNVISVFLQCFSVFFYVFQCFSVFFCVSKCFPNARTIHFSIFLSRIDQNCKFQFFFCSNFRKLIYFSSFVLGIHFFSIPPCTYQHLFVRYSLFQRGILENHVFLAFSLHFFLILGAAEPLIN